MEEHQFDTLTRGLLDLGGSRRTLLRLAGVLAVPAVYAADASSAGASARKRCRRNHGISLSKGDCHCGYTSASTDPYRFHCHDNTDCFCYETAVGKGFCGLLGTFTACSSDSDCPAEQTCIVYRNDSNAGGSCTDSSQCPTGYGCVKSVCQTTLCAAACPT